MKLIYVVIILLIASVVLFRSSYNLHHANDNINKLEIESNSYLESLTRTVNMEDQLNVVLLNGDTINVLEKKKPTIIFYFSPQLCMTCVEENIYELFSLNETNFYPVNILIISTNKYNSYIKVLSKTNNKTSIDYGYYLKEKYNSKLMYYLISDNGKLSNKYFPQKGQFKVTQRYLHYLMNKYISDN